MKSRTFAIEIAKSHGREIPCKFTFLLVSGKNAMPLQKESRHAASGFFVIYP